MTSSTSLSAWTTADRNDFTSVAFDQKIAGGLAVAVLLIHLAANAVSPYEFHRDEFLYFAMGNHLRLWHMDFPPFIAIVARVSHALFHESIAGMRLAPAVSHAVITGCTAWVAWAFGGRPSAQALAALAVATSPLFLRAGSLFQPVTFDQLWWTLALVALIVRIRDDDPRHWIGIGVFLGLGALTKFSVAFIAAGIVVAAIATPVRRDIVTRWPWIALVIAVVIGHPSIVGQIALDWPVFNQMQSLREAQLARVDASEYIIGQLLWGPVTILGVIGAVWLWRTRFRAVAIATLVAFALLLVTHGKSYYAGPVYPVLCAAGAVAIAQLGLRVAPKRPTIPLAVAALAVALFALPTLPFGLPILEPYAMARYAASGVMANATVSNRGETLALPQDYADMLGWTALVDTVARVYRSLPPDDQIQVALIATNYGRAGALEFFGPGRRLPGVVSSAGSFWFFGPGTRTGVVSIVVGGTRDDLSKYFEEITEVARTDNPVGVPEEQSVAIFLCRKPPVTLQEAWPRLAGQN